MWLRNELRKFLWKLLRFFVNLVRGNWASVHVNAVGAEPSMLGFSEFIYKHIIPACFLAPMKPTFDLSDAQTIQVFDACDKWWVGSNWELHCAAAVTPLLHTLVGSCSRQKWRWMTLTPTAWLNCGIWTFQGGCLSCYQTYSIKAPN